MEKAEINLKDCLACRQASPLLASERADSSSSGCITSTESLLITLQSHNEVLSFISSNPASSSSTSDTNKHRTPVLSISPQTLASLSASYSSSSGRPHISLLTLLRRIRAFLGRPENGGWKVWDTTFSRHVSLRETVVEYHERKGKGKAALPILASACPGWVCYAEKAQADLLPLLSAARSSQGIMGALVKTWWGGRVGLKPDEMYHVTAMPCYDKKLEASRSDFYSSIYSTREVDCVLTTGELDLLLSDLGFDPLTAVAGEDLPAPTDISDSSGSPWPELLTHQGSSSGSYLGTLLRELAETHPNPTRIIAREIRGSTDNVEYLLEDALTGEVIFKGAKCYGFRNLQNLVRKVGKETGSGTGRRSGAKLSLAIAARRRKARTGAGEVNTPTTDGSDVEGVRMVREEKKLDFVEVMACPGGCVNGGGQMKPVTKVHREGEVDEEGYERPMADEGVDEGMRWSTREWVAKVEEIYWSGLPTPPPSPTLPAQHLTNDNGVEDGRYTEADRLAEEVVKDACGEDEAKRWEFLRTRFRKVEGDVLQGGVSHEAVKW